jgi:cytidylate kinase
VTIDGPGGSGKDTLAENLVKSHIFEPYSVTIFNTGNFSRSIAYETICQNISPQDPDFKQAAIQAMNEIDFINVDQTNLFTSQVEKTLSHLAAMPEIREGFAIRLPKIIETIDTDIALVLGRITGSLYQSANLKLYLETSPDVCAHRRAWARSAKGEDYETVKQDLIERNKNDIASWTRHYTLPADTIYINTDELIDLDVFQRAANLVSGKFPKVA